MTRRTCQQCRQPIDGDPKVYDKKIVPGVPANCGVPSTWPFYFHPKCFPTWYKEMYRGFAELDQPLNDCKQFRRNGSTQYGMVVKSTGETWPDPLWQARTIDELKTFVPGFREWWGDERWIARWEAEETNT